MNVHDFGCLWVLKVPEVHTDPHIMKWLNVVTLLLPFFLFFFPPTRRCSENMTCVRVSVSEAIKV